MPEAVNELPATGSPGWNPASRATVGLSRTNPEKDCVMEATEFAAWMVKAYASRDGRSVHGARRKVENEACRYRA